ncbi:ribosome biogenesis GTP-binding protein YihA/YsxC [Oceanidesulfovibrio marinus]|uniref:Probable GTP-binding protein EngB n=1 Tax=Oceanidesulfovibrio marinus TaxID=370038 RepID=A0A6P1ZI61_9BACT|nr:ribosome biogenesis GTP-binding protein YihA/YsxC [Oceanidesulfovibrio marinus]TVM34993.1 YihA family ribosome biogenesis GTP-binding protein [Oceanidesulfovibrio marinus]
MPPTLILETTAYTEGQLAHKDVPQVALAGRSNVGKSSLINTLAGRRKPIAKVSATPGKTRSINFYRVEPGDFFLVDLPGYGYARCSKSERAKWAKLTQTYLTKTPELRGVVILLDSRLEPQRIDIELVEYCRSQKLPILPVLTKADKCKQRERARVRKAWGLLLGNVPPLFFSSFTGEGVDELWEAIHDATANDEQEQAEDA